MSVKEIDEYFERVGENINVIKQAITNKHNDHDRYKLITDYIGFLLWTNEKEKAHQLIKQMLGKDFNFTDFLYVAHQFNPFVAQYCTTYYL
jgi:hypothetical protein